MGILSWIIFGLIAGALAKWIMPGQQGGGIFLTILLGVAGAFVGGRDLEHIIARPDQPRDVLPGDELRHGDHRDFGRIEHLQGFGVQGLDDHESPFSCFNPNDDGRAPARGRCPAAGR